MEKIISFAIPCFNSSAYMRKCIDLLVQVGEEIEVLIVDDGSSKDNTYEIALEYQNKYPTIVKAIHQENKGHGGAVNTGLANATGKYFKVVDSDDWINTEDVIKLLNIIKSRNDDVDLYITNYVYERSSDNSTHVVTYFKSLKPNQVSTWGETKPFPIDAPLLMHSLLYKRSILVEKTNLKLPEHTFYVDNIYAYAPIAHVETIYYADINLYHYFIGRDDQSVAVSNMFKRYEQQIRVMSAMFKAFKYDELKSFNKMKKRYLLHDLKQLYTVTTFFVIGGKDNVKARKKAWKEFMKFTHDTDKKLHRLLKFRSYTSPVSWLPWCIKSPLSRFIYKIFKNKLKLGA